MVDLNFDKCVRCNDVFFRVASPVCLKCQETEEEDFKKIRDVLATTSNLNVEQLAEAAEVGTDCVLRMLEDERIVNVVSSAAVPCGRCGEPAISHTKRLCQRCLIALENECSASMRALKEKIGDEYRDNLQTVHEAVERKREKTVSKVKEAAPAPQKTGKGMAIHDRLTRKFGGR
jgi:hypothetical protein